MRRDEARDEVRGGRLWPAGLLVTETTLRQHADRIAGLRLRMTHALARDCGYAEAEILDVLGPDDGAAAHGLAAIDREALRAAMADVGTAIDALYAAVPALREHPGAVAAALDRMTWDRSA